MKAAKGKGKDNVWSIDNDAANESRGGDKRKKGDRRRTKVRNSTTKRRRASESDEGIMVSGSMLIETEKVLQTQVWLSRFRSFLFQLILNFMFKLVSVEDYGFDLK